MSDESAAGRKTDHDGLEVRLLAALEEHFHGCSQVLRDCRKTVAERGCYTDEDLRTALQFTRAGAQTANLIARIAMLKSSGSIPQ